MRVPWYIASILSAACFPVLALVVFHVWTIENPNLGDKLQNLWYFREMFESALVAFLVSSILAIFLSSRRNVLSVFLALLLTWLLIAAIGWAILQLPGNDRLH